MRPTRMVVYRSRIQHNLRTLAKSVPGQSVMAVVKADAYGHGAREVSRWVLSAGASCLGVALPREGSELREAGIAAPILVFGSLDTDQAEEAVRQRLMPTVHDEESFQIIEEAARRSKRTVSVHLKVDTGMGRMGLGDVDDIVKIAKSCDRSQWIDLSGIYTHYAVSESEPEYTRMQIDRYRNILSALTGAGIEPYWRHLSNTGGVIEDAEEGNMARLGIGLYGYHPAGGNRQRQAGLKPAADWLTAVAQVKPVAKGESISYGRTFITERDSLIAVLPVGYADGYPRQAGNVGHVLVRGRKAPIVGRVCMDQIMIDVTDIGEVYKGDTVVLMGRQEKSEITADDIAVWADTISYDILTGISSRVPRVYEEQ